MSTDSRTQAIPRVAAAAVAVTNARVAGPAPDAEAAASAPDAEAAASAPDAEAAASAPDAEAAASAPGGEIASEESVEEMYEAARARLEALHDRWATAMAEIREAQASSEPGATAA